MASRPQRVIVIERENATRKSPTKLLIGPCPAPFFFYPTFHAIADTMVKQAYDVIFKQTKIRSLRILTRRLQDTHCRRLMVREARRAHLQFVFFEIKRERNRFYNSSGPQRCKFDLAARDNFSFYLFSRTRALRCGFRSY